MSVPLFGNQVIAEAISSEEVTLGLVCETTQRRGPREDEGRDRKDAATSQGMLASPEAGRGSKDPPLQISGGGWPCQCLDVGLLAC